MKSKRLCAMLLLGTFIHHVSIANNSSEEKAQYYDKLDEVNQIIDYMNNNADLCPLSPIVTTCGDNFCDHNFEDKENCPADCVVTSVRSYDHVINCGEVQELLHPTTVEDLQTIIKHANKNRLHVRMAGSLHTVNDSICTKGIVISMQKFNNVIGIEHEPDGSESVVVEPSVTMEELSDWLHLRGRSLGYAQLGFRKATIAGAAANGAHGSSPTHTSVVSSIMRAATIINPNGDIIEVSDKNPLLLRGIRAHLGMLGIVIRLKLEIRPQFNLETLVTTHDDALILDHDGLKNLINDCDFVLLNWFPALNKFVRTCGRETELMVDQDAQNILLKTGIPDGLIAPFKLVLHYGMCYPALNAELEMLRYLWLKLLPPLEKRGPRGNVEHTNKAIGYSHRMQSSDFVEPAQHFFQNDWELAIPFLNVPTALKALHERLTKNDLHFPLIGVLIRFVPSQDKSLLAHSSSIGTFKEDETVAIFEFPTPRAIGFSKERQALIDQPYEDIVKTLITEFDARPHWGKNREWALKLALDHGAYGENLSLFQSLARTVDPNGMFLNDFTFNVGLMPKSKVH